MSLLDVRPRAVLAALSAAVLLGACGGGGGDGTDASATGTLRLALTDAPACGFDEAHVTVEKVRVHRSGSAADGDAGWSEVVLDTPRRIDLLTLTNGTLLPLGQTELPAGTYTQMRLVLAPNTPADPLANAVKPTGGTEVALTTPSGQQSGLKMNVSLDVPAGQVADFAIDFDACKSFVRAGNSGRVLLKPVLRVIPLLSAAGQRVIGWVDPALATAQTRVSLQAGGVPVRATPPAADGRFELYPVPAGDYDLVLTAAGRVHAVMTDVPVADAAPTTIGSATARLDLPATLGTAAVGGVVTRNASVVQTEGAVRAVQRYTDGTLTEVAYAAADADTGVYAMTLATSAPVALTYAAGATRFPFAADATAAGRIGLEATVPGAAMQSVDLTPLAAGSTTVDFSFVAP